MLVKTIELSKRQLVSNNQRSEHNLKDSKKVSQMRVFSSVTHFLSSIKGLITIILIIQIALLYLVLNPQNLLNQLNVIQVVNDVSELSQVPPQEIPVIAVIGDMKNLPTVSELVKANEINATVYGQARDGDYVLGYSTKMIIYRKSERRIIYDGDSPAMIQQKFRQNLVNQAVMAAKSKGLVKSDSNEIPSVNLITNADLVKSTNPTFYSNLQNDDLVAVFHTEAVVVIYRPSTDEIINSGKITTVIN